MPKFSFFLITGCAFALGFALNEYRHSQLPIQPPMASNLPAPEPLPQVSPAEPAVVTVSPKTDVVQANSQVDSQADIEEHIRHNRYPEARALLQTYLVDHDGSAQAWYLLARVEQQLKHPKTSVDAWFRYLKLERDTERRERALRELRQYLQQLKDAPSLYGDDYPWLLAQLDQLASLSLVDGELHLLMASVALLVKDSYQAQYHALMAVNDPQVQARAEKLLAKLNGENLPADLAIPLERIGNQFMVSVSIEGNPARLLLDTGASLSGVSSNYLARFPALIKNPRPIRLNTAGGMQDSVLFTVSSLSFGGLNFTQHLLTQLPMDNGTPFEGLLGVDILGRFDFVIDQDAAVLRLKARSSKN